MTHLVPLISDLALILTLAGLATILCKKFNQPLILGYMLAGFLASPHFTLLPNVIDGDSITIARAEQRILLAVPHNISFYETLHSKMMWDVDIRN